jgi:hypothetical protein
VDRARSSGAVRVGAHPSAVSGQSLCPADHEQGAEGEEVGGYLAVSRDYGVVAVFKILC